MNNVRIHLAMAGAESDADEHPAAGHWPTLKAIAEDPELSDHSKTGLAVLLLFLVEHRPQNASTHELMRLGYWRRAEVALGIRPGGSLHAVT
jgi:hypothetical protein